MMSGSTVWLLPSCFAQVEMRCIAYGVPFLGGLQRD